MCGIAGIVGPNPDPKILERMLQKIRHRGPDHTEQYFDKNYAALGHNRLAIIDLSANANEPFIDNSGRYVLIFNGEIYNYPELKSQLKNSYEFRTQSDVEVLLAAYIFWGKECLSRFNGMFSFAIWDNQDKKLFAARDRFGVKPFYYKLDENHLYFASEIKSLTDKNQPNLEVWSSYFQFGNYGMPWETFYEDVLQLPGGYSLQYESGKLKTEKWYSLKDRIVLQQALNFDEAKDHYLELLKDSIRLRFRADVPVGFNLSGGVDSSLLLALVNQYQRSDNISAFTFYTGDSRYDEIPWVEKMIQRTHNPLHKILLQAEEIEERLSFICTIQDEPFGGIPTLAYSKIFQQASAKGIKVLLDGQGMDEQWAGYDYYFQNSDSTIQGTAGISPFKPNMLDPEFAGLAGKPEFEKPFKDTLLNLQYRDLFYTKIPRALRFNDRVSMAYSTELREPFLDYRLVEFAFAQPKSFKISDGSQKFLLRELIKPMVSDDISYAPKRALQTPQREWLGDDLKEFVEEKIRDLKLSAYSEWFNAKEIENQWKMYQSGQENSSFHIWQLINTAQLLY